MVMMRLSSLVVTGAIFLYGLQEAHGQDVAADGGIVCPAINQTPGLCLFENNELQNGGQLTCTAGDIEKDGGNEAKVEVTEITTGCTGADSTATFEADLTYTVSGGATRYDIGLYVASDADADGYNGDCNIFSFGCLGPEDPPEDACGDRQGFNREEGLVITTACVANADGKFKVPYCFSYSQNVDDITCTLDANGAPQPSQAIPGAPAKCQCDEFDLGAQICLVNLNLDATQLQPACTNFKLEDILISSAGITIVSAASDSFEYEISPGNDGPQEYVAGEDIAIANPTSETTYTIVVRRSDGDVACEDTFEITTPECGPDTCGDDFTGPCEPGTSLVDGAVECKDADDAPTPCTDAICCEQDTCGDDFTGPCEPGTSLVDGAVECKDADDAPTPCTDAICCEQGEACADYVCATEGNVNNPDAAADICTDGCTDDQCCVPLTCDTSYGCEDVQGGSCLSPPLNGIEGVTANRWGWYLESTFDSTDQSFTFDMYAGAGQNDLSSGALAGNVVVNVIQDGSSDYTVHPADGYCFDDVHVHVGNELPTKTKKSVTTPTVAPGQYSQSTLGVGDFYIIVHVGETCTPCGH